MVPRRPGDGTVVWTVRNISPQKVEPEVVAGDIFHNLRAALDHLAVDLVALNQRSPKDVYFPFASSADDLDQQINKKKFFRASPEAIELLKAMRPYRGGDERLRAIHDLDVTDKHRRLVQVDIYAKATASKKGEKPPFSDVRLPVLNNAVALIVPESDSPDESHIWLEARYSMTHFPFAGEDAMKVFSQLINLVESVVDQFDALEQKKTLITQQPV